MNYFLDKRTFITPAVSALNLGNSLNLTKYITDLSTGVATSTNLTTILLAGNTTGGTDISMTAGDIIEGAGTTNQIDLNATGAWQISSDAGTLATPYVYGDATDVYLYTGANAGFGAGVDFAQVTHNGTGMAGEAQAVIGSTQFIVNDTAGLLPNAGNIYVTANGAGATTSDAAQNVFVNVNTAGAACDLGIDNSVTLGGVGLTARTANTAYANQISLQRDSSAFDCLIVPPIAGGNRTYDLPDNDGTILINRVVSTAIGITAANGQTILGTSGVGGITISLPATPVQNDRITIKKVDVGAGAITVDGNGNTIDGLATQPLANQWDFMTVESDGTNWFIVALG